MSLNLWGNAWFMAYVTAPWVAWLLFLWALISGLELISTPRRKQLHIGLSNNDADGSFHILFQVLLIAATVSVPFGIARLGLDVFEISVYTGNFHMEMTRYDAVMRFVNTLIVYSCVSLYIVYRRLEPSRHDKTLHSILFSLGISYVPGYILFFVVQTFILGMAWWFPMPDGHGWSEAQIHSANMLTVVSKWFPAVSASILAAVVLRRLKRPVSTYPGK